MALAQIPKTYSKLVAVSVTTNFKEAVRIMTVNTPAPKPGELLVRARYAGINASDINVTAGRYSPGIQPPFDTGMEGMGEVVQVGPDQTASAYQLSNGPYSKLLFQITRTCAGFDGKRSWVQKQSTMSCFYCFFYTFLRVFLTAKG